nr:ATP-binding protein [Novosphingobium sp. 9]
MGFFHRLTLSQRLLAILVLATVLDIAANVVLLDRANAVQLHRDDAARIAESAVLAGHLLELLPQSERPAVAQSLSSTRFHTQWATKPPASGSSVGLTSMRQQIVAQAPALAKRSLKLHVGNALLGDEVGGSLKLADGTYLVFETDVRSAWTLDAARLLGIAFPNLVLVLTVWLLARAILEPLRALVSATRQVGTAPPTPIVERGPAEVRQLIGAINQMQHRIDQSLRDRTQTMLAIGHDLRTPLSRLRLRLDGTPEAASEEEAALDPESRQGFETDITEMLHLLDSLQAYVDGNGRELPPEGLDVAVMVATLVDSAADIGADATYFGPDNLEIMAHPVSLRRAVSNLIENALHYGGCAKVVLTASVAEVVIAVEDNGPGIPRIASPMRCSRSCGSTARGRAILPEWAWALPSSRGRSGSRTASSSWPTAQAAAFVRRSGCRESRTANCRVAAILRNAKAPTGKNAPPILLSNSPP